MTIRYLQKEGRTTAQYEDIPNVPKGSIGLGSTKEEAFIDLLTQYDAGGDGLSVAEYSLWDDFIRSGEAAEFTGGDGPSLSCLGCSALSTRKLGVGNFVSPLCLQDEARPRRIPGRVHDSLSSAIITPIWCNKKPLMRKDVQVKSLLRMAAKAVHHMVEVSAVLDDVYPTAKKTKSRTDMINVLLIENEKLHTEFKKLEHKLNRAIVT